MIRLMSFVTWGILGFTLHSFGLGMLNILCVAALVLVLCFLTGVQTVVLLTKAIKEGAKKHDKT